MLPLMLLYIDKEKCFICNAQGLKRKNLGLRNALSTFISTVLSLSHIDVFATLASELIICGDEIRNAMMWLFQATARTSHYTERLA